MGFGLLVPHNHLKYLLHSSKLLDSGNILDAHVPLALHARAT